MTVGKDVSALFPDVANCMQVSILTHGFVKRGGCIIVPRLIIIYYLFINL